MLLFEDQGWTRRTQKKSVSEKGRKKALPFSLPHFILPNSFWIHIHECDSSPTLAAMQFIRNHFGRKSVKIICAFSRSLVSHDACYQALMIVKVEDRARREALFNTGCCQDNKSKASRNGGLKYCIILIFSPTFDVFIPILVDIENLWMKVQFFCFGLWWARKKNRKCETEGVRRLQLSEFLKGEENNSQGGRLRQRKCWKFSMKLLVLTHFPPRVSATKLLRHENCWCSEGDKPLTHRQWDRKMRENLKGEDAGRRDDVINLLGVLSDTCAGVNLPLPLEHFSFSSSQFFLPYNCGRATEHFRSRLRGKTKNENC